MLPSATPVLTSPVYHTCPLHLFCYWTQGFIMMLYFVSAVKSLYKLTLFFLNTFLLCSSHLHSFLSHLYATPGYQPCFDTTQGSVTRFTHHLHLTYHTYLNTSFCTRQNLTILHTLPITPILTPRHYLPCTYPRPLTPL